MKAEMLTVSDLDIYRTANVLIEKYGENALFQAMSRCAKMQETGDHQGQGVWNHIANAVEWLQMPAALVSETTH